ncbi:hypothetical protein M0802_016149, partial [Mischocyttarus mexicanus]
MVGKRDYNDYEDDDDDDDDDDNDERRVTKTDTDVITMLSYLLIIVGALTFIASFLGYCGAMFESRCLLCTAEKGTQSFLKSTIKYYAANADQTETVTVAWDGIMSQ